MGRTVTLLFLLVACGSRSALDGAPLDAAPDAPTFDAGKGDVEADADATIPFDAPITTACLAHIAAGETDTCAIKLDGSLWCWGRNESSALPVEMKTFGHDVAAVSAGYDHVCASLKSGTAWCWGRNNFGQLGTGNNVDATVPTQVVGLSDVVALSAGDRTTCAIKTDGTVWCWGYGAEGQLGGGLYLVNSNAPVQVVGFHDAAEVSVGGDHTCARRTDGTAWCWGFNGSGQLGDGDAGWQTNSSVPVQVTPLGASVARVTAASFYTCAEKTDGTIWCWPFGPCETEVNATPPVSTIFGSDNVQSAAKGEHTCVRKVDGTMECCGDGDGIPITTTSTLVNVPLGAIDEMAVGNFTTCARTASAMWCWGLNVDGQVGDGTKSGEQCWNDDPYQAPSPPWVCRRTPTPVVGICP